MFRVILRLYVPTHCNKAEKSAVVKFRKFLQRSGFTKFDTNTYTRPCTTVSTAKLLDNMPDCMQAEMFCVPESVLENSTRIYHVFE